MDQNEYKVSEQGVAPFHIYHDDKRVAKFYRLNAPYELTYIVCSGAGEEDYVNSVTLSGDNSYMSQETFHHHAEEYRNHPGHFHDYFEIMIVLSGNVTQKIEGQEYKYPVGSCCMVSRGLCHYERYEGEASVLFLGFSKEYIMEMFASGDRSIFNIEKSIHESPLYRFIMEDLEHPGCKNYLDFFPSMENEDAYKILHDLTTCVMNLATEPHFGASYLMAGYMCSFLYHLSQPQRYLCTRVDLSVTNEDLLFTRITNLLKRENGRVTREELESVFSYSGDYLNRIIKKHSGMSLFDYGMVFCMQEAGKRLAESSAAIAEIAEELGFSNRTHFYNIFKKHYGMTPKQFRERCIGEDLPFPNMIHNGGHITRF